MRVPLEIVNARRERLAAMLREHRYLPIQELRERLGVSVATIRRDLSYLEKHDILQRTYGGALLDYEKSFASFDQRRMRARTAKLAIAVRARQLLKPGMTIYLDGGTTLDALALEIAKHPVKDLTVMTNNLAIAEHLGDVEQVRLELTGGTFLKRQSILLGDRTLATIQDADFDAAFLGAEAINEEGFWNTFDPVVQVQQGVLDAAKTTYLCVDQGKLDGDPKDLVAGWSCGVHLITDATAKQLGLADITLAKSRLLRTKG